ncbi:MAG TPA: acyl-CoA dehydrogenase family protein [Vicinamibacterales bacterium]|nr:acyl-CoA dehydrogenase family protein [Vicinamibacterales bacterium]
MTTARRGGDWLVTATDPAAVFTPERLSDEHRLIAQMAAEFVDQEVAPALPALEAKDWDTARRLIVRAGELGLLGTDVPESAGGAGLDKAASVVATEAVGAVPSFATTFGAQTGLAIVPILCFGTPEQQAAWLPRIVSGEIIGAYCLSEAASGSDALGARARATREPDGSWRLTGEKLWVTNGGFADFFIVFAKVDGEHFTAFIVERGQPGVTSGKEEHKMGLHGSSTTPVVLADVRVPAANLLGEVGRGHKIAFNVLNYGRFKLAAMCTGGARPAIAEAAAYASTRRQFGQPIASFGAVRSKLADMTTALFAVESMLYRTTGLIDEAIAATPGDPASVARVLEEFALEASILKVASSEMLDAVVDENVQIHGGNGFVRDYPAERRLRDARVNRIFEGTNEINRLLIPGLLVKRARAGALSLGAARDPRSRPAVSTPDVLKATAVELLNLAVARHGDGLAEEQEVVMRLADLVIDAFGADSAALRAAAAAASQTALASLHADAAAIIADEARQRARTHVDVLVAALATGADAASLRERLDAPLAGDGLDIIATNRRIADVVVDRRRYPFP